MTHHLKRSYSALYVNDMIDVNFVQHPRTFKNFTSNFLLHFWKNQEILDICGRSKRNGNLLVKLGELAGLLTLEAIWLNMHNYAS